MLNSPGLRPGRAGSRRIQVVDLELSVGQVGFHDPAPRYVVEPGNIDVLVGTSSRDLAVAGSFTVLAGSAGEPPAKAFDGAVHVG